MNGGTKVLPTRSLLQGGSYTPSASTDLKATFERIRAEQAAAVKTNVKPMRKRS